MRALANYVMRSRVSAVTVIMASTLLAFILPPLTSPLAYVGSAALGLVTLRRGAREGGILLAVSVLGMAVIGWVVMGSALALGLTALVQWLPLWAGALVLRVTMSWVPTLYTLLGIGAAVILFQYLALGDPGQWWHTQLQAFADRLQEQAQGAELEAVFSGLAPWMPALVSLALTTGLVLSLLLARAWQSQLYNPGGFAEEFRGLRLGRALGLLTVAGMLIAMAMDGPLGQIAAQLTWLAAAGCLLQGIAVIHGLVALTGKARGWLVAMYLLLIFLEPYTAIVLAGLGVADGWVDFRQRVAGPRA